jgi:membrane protein YdbS with pleckstrin-like domain
LTPAPQSSASSADEFGPVADGVTWLRPSPRLLLLRRVEVAVPTLVLALVFLGAALSDGEAEVAALVVVLVAGLGAEWFLRRRVRAWGYAERADDLLVKRGVLISRLSVVPYGRMQFVDVTAGPLERAFKLATVRLHTAAAASDARIPGLAREEAERLRDSLAALGEAQAAGL